jgi:hypothetical protein
MGLTVLASGASMPALTFALGDRDSLSILGQPAAIESRRIILPVDFRIPNFERDEDFDPLRMMRTTRTRPGFFRELVDYYSMREATVPIGFVVTNDGTVPALDIDAIVEIDDPRSELTVVVDSDLPKLPMPTVSIYEIAAATHSSAVFNQADVLVRRVGAYWRVDAAFGKIRPRETIWTSCKLCIGAPTSRTIVLRVRLHGDNLPEPIAFEQMVELRVTELAETLEALVQRYVDETGIEADREGDDDM